MERKPNVPRILLALSVAGILITAVALAVPRVQREGPVPVPPPLPAEPPPAMDPSAMSLPPEVEAEPEEVAPAAKPVRPVIEVAFVLDTTGSMAGLLEGAKRKIWSIASRIGSGQPRPDLRVGLVAYRDVGDAYVTRVHDLSGDLDQVFANLSRLRADGGGDWPEHVGRALGEAVSKLSWSQDGQVLRMIFVVGDAPPQDHGDGWSFTTWAKRAKARGITVSAIRCGSAADTEVAFRRLASLAGGSFHSIGADGGMREVATPYDAELAEVTRDIAGKTLYAGRAGARARAEDRKAELDAMPAEAAADRAGFMTGKGASLAPAAPSVAGLVGDLAAAPSKLDGLAEADLPDELQGLSPAERKARVGTVARERSALEQRARELSSKRAAWIAEHARKDGAGLDARVMKDVRAGAARIGVAY